MMNIDVFSRLELTPDDILGHMTAILGMTGSGKSNTAAVITEELLSANVPVCVVDTAGEYYGLKEKFDIWEIGRGRDPNRTIDATIGEAAAPHAARTAYTNAASTILNLSGFNRDGRDFFIAEYMETIWNLAPHHRHPYVIVLEEAHHFIPQRGRVPASEVLVSIAAEGRKQGLNIIMSSQRSARLDKDVITQAGLAFLHQVRHPADLAVYYDLIPRPRSKVKDAISRLKVGEALVMHGSEVQRHTIRKRHTTHGGHTPTVADLPTRRGIQSASDFLQPTLPLQLVIK